MYKLYKVILIKLYSKNEYCDVKYDTVILFIPDSMKSNHNLINSLSSTKSEGILQSTRQELKGVDDNMSLLKIFFFVTQLFYFQIVKVRRD